MTWEFIICTLREGKFKTKKVRWAGHVARVAEMTNVDESSVKEPEGKRPFATHRHTCEDNIKLDLESKKDMQVWTELIWLTVGRGGGLL